jgi:putative N6-adenine-specific DNA methylase
VAGAPPTLAAFAIAAPGLEPIVAAELAGLGIPAAIDAGGVAWTGTAESIARANLWLRTASRVVVRFGEFRARTFQELERHARKLPWERFVAAGAPVRFRVTSRKSRLYHTAAIAERLGEATTRRAGAAAFPRDAASAGTTEEGDGYDGGDESAVQLFIVRVVRDICTVSVDTSGALLHRRGYRQAVAKAPLRETIAAAMLLGSEWPATAPLMDPMCGSGTIPIEAALMARRIAPGLSRGFAFLAWPGFEVSMWSRLVAEAREKELPSVPAPISASDRDAGAIEAARANADRARVAADIELDRRPLSALESPGGGGWLVTNPPYGVRVAERTALRDLYAAFGNVARARFAGWTVAMLSPLEVLERQVGLDFRERFRTLNGGIPVRLMTATVES